MTGTVEMPGLDLFAADFFLDTRPDPRPAEPLPAPRQEPEARPMPARAASAFPVGHPLREGEMVCDFAAGFGFCPAPTGALGPMDLCRRAIGTIGFQRDGVAVCWACFVRLTAGEPKPGILEAEPAAAPEAPPLAETPSVAEAPPLPGTPAAPETWPRLSRQLSGPRDLRHCQGCGLEADPTDGIALRGWQEHDDGDRPERVLVMLCRPCGDRLVEKHPRLYRRLEPNEPWPGALPVCAGCAFQQEVGCCHPDDRVNGLRGNALAMPRPQTVFVDGRFGPKGGRRGGFTVTTYGAATACAGREEFNDFSHAEATPAEATHVRSPLQ